MTAAGVTVGIPTFARGEKVLEVLGRLLECRPAPAEIIVHVDASDTSLERKLEDRFPSVRTITSTLRVGPGGGRHRCILSASHPIFCSFDDDSWPIDADFFARVEEHFAVNADAACLAASVFHRDEQPVDRINRVEETTDYVGCGYAIRTDSYRELPGHVDRPVAYGMEERDLSLQIAGAGRKILMCHDLRVFHDTCLEHHQGAEVTAGTIQNAALLPWLRYPVRLWPYACLQFANVFYFLLSQRRIAGMGAGLVSIPRVLWRLRGHRSPIPAPIIRTYLRRRRRLA